MFYAYIPEKLLWKLFPREFVNWRFEREKLSSLNNYELVSFLTYEEAIPDTKDGISMVEAHQNLIDVFFEKYKGWLTLFDKGEDTKWDVIFSGAEGQDFYSFADTKLKIEEKIENENFWVVPINRNNYGIISELNLIALQKIVLG